MSSSVRFLVDVNIIAIQAGFWASVAFPVFTSSFWPWWDSWWGRNIVSLELVIALALLSPVLQLEFGLRPGSTPGHVLLWVSTVSLCLVPVIIVWRSLLIWLTQRRGLAERDQAPAD